MTIDEFLPVALLVIVVLLMATLGASLVRPALDLYGALGL